MARFLVFYSIFSRLQLQLLRGKFRYLANRRGFLSPSSSAGSDPPPNKYRPASSTTRTSGQGVLLSGIHRPYTNPSGHCRVRGSEPYSVFSD
ncbi:hypothetical protein SODALDRAFT_363899 [Sodiomyces alkalinus F11]|uniref:Uncharacterized protein n=1 Tax=Sodiomyces alkalinus (strain CBS 110278 / VKM F-3762 / F11) TaxID=1314773 RepID=A0A3N2PL01_SODAK|nr:hypothetical protein SODALDRAFT_363899 [Sodiomyces alkalinus F11]ROT35211.1 hypothetical protein SODALDRAFT_363899 [Sodiomyces alkalinus F11]